MEKIEKNCIQKKGKAHKIGGVRNPLPMETGS